MPLGRKIVDEEVKVDYAQFVSVFMVEVVCGYQGRHENTLNTF